jgi:hypothetical protein
MKPSEMTITPKSRVPLYVLGSAIVMTAVMTLQWADLRFQIREALTMQQAQDWIDTMREKNPSMYIAPVPPKRSEAVVPPVASLSNPTKRP